MVDKQTVIACIKTFNGEYSDRGFAKMLTGFYVFKFIPRFKNSQYFGIFKDCDSDEILKLIYELKKEGVIAENNNSKLFIVETSTKNIEKEEDNKALDEVIELIKQNRNIFVTGGAGTGKSYILNKLKNKFKETLHITSTTGISAINVNGQTIHSWAGIGLANKPVEEVIKKIKKNKALYKQLILCKMLAIDEISMLNDYVFDYINEVLKQIRENNSPFGGIQVLLFGDFFQLPPVDETRNYCFKSQTWQDLNLKTIVLNECKRQSEKELIDALNNVRIDHTSIDNLKVFYERDIAPETELSKDILRIFSTNNDADTYNSEYNYEYLKKFFISVIWRMSVSKLEHFEGINLGKYEKLALDILKNNIPMDENFFVIMIRKNPKNSLYNSTFNPIMCTYNKKPCCRISFGGYNCDIILEHDINYFKNIPLLKMFTLLKGEYLNIPIIEIIADKTKNEILERFKSHPELFKK